MVPRLFFQTNTEGQYKVKPIHVPYLAIVLLFGGCFRMPEVQVAKVWIRTSEIPVGQAPWEGCGKSTDAREVLVNGCRTWPKWEGKERSNLIIQTNEMMNGSPVFVCTKPTDTKEVTLPAQFQGLPSTVPQIEAKLNGQSVAKQDYAGLAHDHGPADKQGPSGYQVSPQDRGLGQARIKLYMRSDFFVGLCTDTSALEAVSMDGGNHWIVYQYPLSGRGYDAKLWTYYPDKR